MILCPGWAMAAWDLRCPVPAVLHERIRWIESGKGWAFGSCCCCRTCTLPKPEPPSSLPPSCPLNRLTCNGGSLQSVSAKILLKHKSFMDLQIPSICNNWGASNPFEHLWPWPNATVTRQTFKFQVWLGVKIKPSPSCVSVGLMETKQATDSAGSYPRNVNSLPLTSGTGGLQEPRHKMFVHL